jgi:hypothetical protein
MISIDSPEAGINAPHAQRHANQPPINPTAIRAIGASEAWRCIFMFTGSTMSLRKVAITRTTDHDGKRIALVPITNSDLPAKLLEADYDRLIAAGLTMRWAFNEVFPSFRYVRAQTGAGNLVTISRLVAGAGAGQRVRHKDSDRLNLRHDNLQILKSTRARHDTLGTLAASRKALRPTICKPSADAPEKLPVSGQRLVHQWPSEDHKSFTVKRKDGSITTTVL